MWYVWTALLVSCALVAGEGGGGSGSGGGGGGGTTKTARATTRAPPLTLDRQAGELAWPSWLQSPENNPTNINAPPRRITTKSLFITPLVCPKGQRLDNNGCVQVVTLNKDEHERILLEQLNALFTSSPNGDIVYDYGDEEPGPLQLSIPISLEPQASPLQAQEPSAQAQEPQPSFVKLDKKDGNSVDAAAGLVAELELLQLQHSQQAHNTSAETINALNHNVLTAIDKNKRDSPTANSTEVETSNSDEGQKELVFGHVNIDTVLYGTEPPTEETTTEVTTESTTEIPVENVTTVTNSAIDLNNNTIVILANSNKTTLETNNTLMLTKDGDKTKLNPENDYADIGEAIKLISRYAEVTTDDNFGKDKKHAVLDDSVDSILGTRTKLQYRRNKTKGTQPSQDPTVVRTEKYIKSKTPIYSYPKKDVFYRYPWQGQHSPTPPPDYPFRHIQDYWPGRNQIGGVYNTGHENPRRHHHTFPHNYYRPHSLSYGNYPLYPGLPELYPGQVQGYPHSVAQHHARPMRSHTNNRDLYTLLGLRHWFSSEGTSKR